jgi:general stress protein YciG
MARRKGDGAMTVAEAGQKGGETTASTHDRSFYQQIGRKGGEIGGQRVRELIEEGKRAEGSL